MNETPRREITLPVEFYVVLGIGLAGYLLYTLSAVVTPLFLAFSIAYVLDPLIDRFEAVKFPRPAAIALVLVTGCGLTALFIALVIPTVARDVAAVANELPHQISTLVIKATPWLTAHGVKVPQTTTEWMAQLGANADALASSVLAPAGGIIGSLLSSGLSMAGSVVAALVVPILSVYFLNDFDRITAGVRSLLPRRYRRIVTEYAREIDSTLSHFIRGQLAVMGIMAILYGASYAILGVRLALPIGILSGILSFIPYLGSAFALISGLLMSLVGGFSPGQLVGVVIAYTIVQTLEGFVIGPRIMSKSLGIPEMWVLVALFVGGEIFGFLGVLLAVPAAAVAKIFVTRAVDIYHESDLYLEGPASMTSIPPPEVIVVATANVTPTSNRETPLAGEARPKSDPPSIP